MSRTSFLLFTALSACRTEDTLVMPDPHLERMLEQRKIMPYRDDPSLPGGMTMQLPPEGTLPADAPSSAFARAAGRDADFARAAARDADFARAAARDADFARAAARDADPLRIKGVWGGIWAERIPIPVDRAMVETGRRRFETFCATCHGMDGSGVSAVAEKMALRKPENLLVERVRQYPPGRVFATIREGYGLMPSYAALLTVDESWSVTAYLSALQLARGTPAAALPDKVRAELAKEAP
jgi:mono/diheme cytochrome c family protein